jgi:antitoxin (DNA-binding transcriptional repressor) of toxin-antitoxin stability system
MTAVKISDARKGLSRLVAAVEMGDETEIIIMRNGHPAAKLVAAGPALPVKRIGVAKGKVHHRR